MSAVEVMLLQMHGKQIPNQEPPKTNMQKTLETDIVIDAVIQARNNQYGVTGSRNMHPSIDCLGVFAVAVTLVNLVDGFGVYAAAEVV